MLEGWNPSRPAGVPAPAIRRDQPLLRSCLAAGTSSIGAVELRREAMATEDVAKAVAHSLESARDEAPARARKRNCRAAARVAGPFVEHRHAATRREVYRPTGPCRSKEIICRESRGRSRIARTERPPGLQGRPMDRGEFTCRMRRIRTPALRCSSLAMQFIGCACALPPIPRECERHGPGALATPSRGQRMQDTLTREMKRARATGRAPVSFRDNRDPLRPTNGKRVKGTSPGGMLTGACRQD